MSTYTRPGTQPTVEDCDAALTKGGLTRTEENYWLDKRNEATRAAELNAQLEQNQDAA